MVEVSILPLKFGLNATNKNQLGRWTSNLLEVWCYWAIPRLNWAHWEMTKFPLIIKRNVKLMKRILKVCIYFFDALCIQLFMTHWICTSAPDFYHLLEMSARLSSMGWYYR